MASRTAPPVVDAPVAAPLPLERMFVLQLAGQPRAGALCGRIEHLLTGRRQDFGSAQELLAMLDAQVATGTGATGGGPA
jgi:hypothetical protein